MASKCKENFKLYKQTNKMHFVYVFILQSLYKSTCFDGPFRSSSGVHNLLYLYCVQTMETCLQTRLHGLYRAADTVNL